MGPLTRSPDELDRWDHRQRRDEEPDLEPDEWSDEDVDRAEDRWIAERDNLYR